MKSSNSLFAGLLIAVFCCTAVGVASADANIPWLTGNFSLQYIDFVTSVAWIDFTATPGWGYPLGLLSFPDVALVALKGDPCLNTQAPPCSGGASGVLAGESLSINAGPYVMSGAVTNGSYSTYVVQTGEYNANWGLSEYFDFTAQWNNGWKSQGDVWLYWDYSLDRQSAAGELNMVTSSVPEPGSLALMGSGILALAGTLRRKLTL
jgi:hypothetical protein